MSNIPETLLAYCAGVIDSDGWITILRSTYEMRHAHCRGVSPVYFGHVGVNQVTPEAVDILHGLFGGRRTMMRRKGCRPLHSWTVTYVRAAVVVQAVLPYLRIKRVQAENVLLLQELKRKGKIACVPLGRGHVGSIPRPKHFTDAMEFCWKTAKRLNAVGVKNHPPSPPGETA